MPLFGSLIMQLLINHQLQSFIPLQKFRDLWNLPDTFQMAAFEAKEWHGLGSVEGAGQALAVVRQRVVQAVPPELTIPNLMPVLSQLTSVFRNELEVANQQVGLRPVEIDFAVSGFYDVLDAVVYHLFDLNHRYRDPQKICEFFDFDGVYQVWLDGSVRVSSTKHTYRHGDIEFQVGVVYNIYGHVGLEVEVANEHYYVMDMSLACPASNYMRDLCKAVAQALCRTLST